MKKTYVTPDIEKLDLNETACWDEYEIKEILSSTGEVIGTEKIKKEKSQQPCGYGWGWWIYK